MTIAKLLPILLVAACSSGPTESESIQVFAATTSAMSSAQGRATVTTDGANTTVDFSGPCALGGSVTVTGRYEGSNDGDRAAFDLTTAFDDCREATGTLDGSLRWTSVVAGTSFHATMTGDISFAGPNLDTSCGFDLEMAVDETSVSYSGEVCGYDVVADLRITAGS